MADAARITIRRQVVDVEMVGTEADGMALQRRLPAVCSDVLCPALESAFAGLDLSDAHLRLDRLTIDLSTDSLDHLDVDLADAVRREVANHLSATPWLPSHEPELAAGRRTHRRTAAETVDDAFIVFLRTGRLPWWFQLPSGRPLERVVLDTWDPPDDAPGPPPTRRARLSEVLAQPEARSRLVMQFTPAFVITVIRRVSPQLATTTEQILAALGLVDPRAPGGVPSPTTAKVGRPTSDVPSFTRRVFNNALIAASAGRSPDAETLARMAWVEMAPIERNDQPLATALERLWPRVIEASDATPVAQVGPNTPRPTRSTPPADPDDDGILVDHDGILVDNVGILVDNAGIVLLHPFLPRFFEGLGLAVDGRLVDRGRALCLLHFLATGERTAPEHQLTVAKVLCDVALAEPVEADVLLTDAHTDEATALLQAATGHWEALRNASPDAVRSEFLTRPGTLATDADGDWLLRVEARTVDILLDQLPWGISLISFPWSPRLLRVEWR